MELVKDLEATDFCLILYAKNTDSWMTVQGNMVNSTVLAAMEFCDFCARVMMLPSSTLPQNVMAALRPYTYITDLAAAMEALS